MAKQKRHHSVRQALLPSALTLALLSMSAYAGNSWVTTHTHARIQATTLQLSSLVTAGRPRIANTNIAALPSSKTLHVEVSLNLRNTDKLDAFLRSVNTPGSVDFHEYLTPAEFKARFAPTQYEVNKVVAYLKASGFRNIKVSPNNMLVSADGTSATVNTAFRANMKTFMFKGQQRYANAADAMVPAALGSIVGSVLGLQNISHAHVMSHKALAHTSTTKSKNASSNGMLTGHDPTEFPAIYDVGNVPNASNTTVGIITWGDMDQTVKDLNTFTQRENLPRVNLKVVSVGTGAPLSNDDESEWQLDSQTVVGMSGGVKQLILYASTDNYDDNLIPTLNKAVVDDAAKVISISWGGGESSGETDAENKIFAQATAQGQTFSVSSGDQGPYQWSLDPENHWGYVADPNGDVKIDLSHYNVEAPANSSYVIAVGGTALYTDNDKWAGETVWNDGLSPADAQRNDYNQVLSAAGAGVSDFEAAPSWQKDVLGSSVTHRVLPDISLDAEPDSGAKIVVKGKLEQWGGTSLAAPLFAAIWARIQSAHDNKLGFPAPDMYKYFANDPSPLHDVTSGNNGYSGYGFSASKGFDTASGWGSLDVAKFNDYVTRYSGVPDTHPAPGNGNTFSNDNTLTIGDNRTVTSSITISGQSSAGPFNLKVHADITHNWSGDLQIVLYSPDGTYQILRQPDYSDDGNIDITRTITINAPSSQANGTWKLRVVDNDPWYLDDYGTLNHWSLAF